MSLHAWIVLSTCIAFIAIESLQQCWYGHNLWLCQKMLPPTHHANQMLRSSEHHFTKSRYFEKPLMLENYQPCSCLIQLTIYSKLYTSHWVPLQHMDNMDGAKLMFSQCVSDKSQANSVYLLVYIANSWYFSKIVEFHRVCDTFK